MEWTRRFFSRPCWLRAPLGVFPCTPPKRAPLRGGAEGRRAAASQRSARTPRMQPPLQSALVALGCAHSSSKRGARQRPSSGRGGARACCSRPDVRPPTPHMPSSDQRPRTAAKRMRTALCATPGGAPGHRGGGGRPAPRPDAPRPRESAPVGVAASGGTSRAAAGTHSTLCVAPSAAGDASQARPFRAPRRAEPRAKGRRGTPRTAARPPSAPGPARAPTTPRRSHLSTRWKGGIAS